MDFKRQILRLSSLSRLLLLFPALTETHYEVVVVLVFIDSAAVTRQLYRRTICVTWKQLHIIDLSATSVLWLTLSGEQRRQCETIVFIELYCGPVDSLNCIDQSLVNPVASKPHVCAF